MLRVATLYNNKGGVSKTTTLFNLGVYLAHERRRRVLLVDCDPQCNLTELFFASSEAVDKPDTDLPGTSIYEALRPRFSGDAGRVDVSSIKLAKSALYPGLSLLRGDLELSMAEAYFATAVNQAITENIHEKQTYCVLSRMLRDLVQKHKFDHVLVDVGPSTGALSRTAFLSCDAFFVPTTPDRFSRQAVSVLGKVISTWIRRHEEIIKTFEPFGLEPFPGRPTFAGAVSQNFKVWGGRAKKSYRLWSDLIAGTLGESFIPEANVPLVAGISRRHPYVAMIQDVGPLAPVAQAFGRAIFDIQQEDSAEASADGRPYSGAVWQNWLIRMTSYRAEIMKLADKLE